MTTQMADSRQTGVRLRLAFLLAVHTVICCVSLVCRSPYHAFHIFYDEARQQTAIITVAAFSAVSLLFVFADFSFGYFVGFYFYTMIVGYLWLGTFSDLLYNRPLAELSAAISAVAFLVPALLISSPINKRFTMSERAFQRLLTLILLLAIGTIALGAVYNFRAISIEKIYDFRDDIRIPRLLAYVIGITSNALLPFAFACFATRKAWWRAGTTLVLLLLFYPITLSKLAFFTPAWLVAFGLLSKWSEPRTAAILSLLLPLAAGITLITFFPAHAFPYFQLVNMRMIAIPSVAMDVYNDFFAHHDLTYFCQISFTKSIFSCPYHEPLSIVMLHAYEIGNFNASLFATEGIASVGPWLAPFSALICGLVIAFGNRASADLPPRLVLMSSAVLAQVLLNVPLTTALLTHGAGVLFLLWYITPRPEGTIKSVQSK